MARTLGLDTAKGRAIENVQPDEITRLEQSDFDYFYRSYQSMATFRTTPSAEYNCHGLTFASKRTGIDTQDALRLILNDDEYATVSPDEVLPGDVILYIGDKGDITHSGIVVERGDAGSFGFPRVVSKWGKFGEVLHWANQCPYRIQVEYWRRAPKR